MADITFLLASGTLPLGQISPEILAPAGIALASIPISYFVGVGFCQRSIRSQAPPGKCARMGFFTFLGLLFLGLTIAAMVIFTFRSWQWAVPLVFAIAFGVIAMTAAK